MTNTIYIHQPERAFSFTRLPNFLFEAPTFKPLSNEAKVLYAFILRRTELSRKNGWADDCGRIYLYYPICEVVDLLHCGRQKAVNTLRELQYAGLVEIQKQGCGKPNRIFPKSYEAVPNTDFAGSDGANVYKFTTTDEYTLLNIYISEYQAGELVNKERMGIGFEGIGSPKNGEIIIVPDYEHAVIKLVISTDEGSKFSTELPIMEGVEDKEYYGRSQSRIEGETKILYDIEQPLVGMIYDNDEMYVIDLYDLLSGETDSLSKNDYMYLFSYEFCKE